MQIGRVVGQAVSTVKHPSMAGWRLLVVQLLTAAGKEDGEPLLAIDNLGAGVADLVILCGEGGAVREMMGHKNAPVRWLVQGICDSWQPTAR
ncbi:MAG TPA: EutN/CcmL family microcompartment protein [Gemmataceae bacterium]|nr:EutN/CcmL family microcompartment protein [Gemmataceae bacterium]